MDGKGREATYNFFTTTEGIVEGQGIGHMGGGKLPSCHPAGAAHEQKQKHGTAALGLLYGVIIIRRAIVDCRSQDGRLTLATMTHR